MNRQRVNLLYLTRRFPESTFIMREIRELSRSKDLNLKIVAFAEDRGALSSADSEIKNRILYFRSRLLRLLFFNAVQLIRYPSRYTELLLLLLGSRRDCRFINKLGDLRCLFVGAALAHEIRGLNLDRIHVHFANRQTTIAMVLSRFLGLPFTFTAYSSDFFSEPILLREEIALSESVIATHKFAQSYLRKLAYPEDREKIVLNYLGVSFRTPLPPIAKSRKEPLILAVGRLVPYKGFPYLIDALSLVKSRGGRFKAAIIGGGPDFDRLQSQIKDKNLSREVEMLGALSFDKVNRYLNRSDIFVAPSITVRKPSFKIDGIPTVLFEAMRAGLPIISTRISGIPEAVEDGENGLLVEEKDAEALAVAIRILLDNNNLRRRFGEAGYRKALKMFNIEKNVKALKRVVLGTSLVDGNR